MTKQITAWQDSQGKIWGSEKEAQDAEELYRLKEKSWEVQKAINRGNLYQFDERVAEAVVRNYQHIKEIMES